MLRKIVLYSLLSAALLIPCFWHSRIQAGDLSSHLYNAWLSNEITAGRAPGLELAAPRTNVLFDKALAWLMQAGGPVVAERVAVSLAVLVLFWGGVAWIRVAAGFVPWFLAPCLAMLSYGWTFHTGLFNFYIACGLTFWALALAWRPTPLRVGAALVVLAGAYSAHAIPVGWGLFVIAYVYAARRLAPGRTMWLAAAACGLSGLTRLFLETHFAVLSTSHQVLEMAGIDQFWVYGVKYAGVSVAMAALWGFLLLRLSHERGMAALSRSEAFQLCVIMSVSILVLPTRIELPGYRMALAFITERMTLPFGFLICLLLSRARPTRWQTWALGGVAIVYFSALYVDTGALNRWEDRSFAAVAKLPPGARVVSALRDWSSRATLWHYPLERACIGRCYSYHNYEPGSWAFRVQARRPNAFVVFSARDAAQVGRGEYVVKEEDLPLYQLTPCEPERLCVQALRSGERIQTSELAFLPALW